MFSQNERIAVFSLATIVAFRMLGLFIIIPIFSPYLQTLSNATPMLIGLTMGIYGLTQAMLQIPLGILSDYIGRREVITIGLTIFLIGSIIAASSHNIWLILLGRAMQGMGAISGTIIALLSDLTSDSVRTKAMAIFGMSIGAAFMLAFMLGPILNSFFTVDRIFYLVAILVLPVIYILWQVVPIPDTNISKYKNSNFRDIINFIVNNKSVFKQLKLYSFSIFSLHGILMANFVAIPILLKNLGYSSYQQGLVYIEVFVTAIIFMLPLIILSEKKKQQKNIILLSVILLFFAELIFWLFSDKSWGIMIGLLIFFSGFNVLEASLPSLVSKIAPKESKGAALGLYSTAQFLGPMIGGFLSGILYKYYDITHVFVLGFIWAVLWLVFLFKDIIFCNEKNLQDLNIIQVTQVKSVNVNPE